MRAPPNYSRSLSSNSLSGTLPPQWSAMRSVTYMPLAGNNSAGMVPWQWRGLRSALHVSLRDLMEPSPSALQEAFGSVRAFDLVGKSVFLRPSDS